jgi:prepilin-type N-terminal cleavage/methylation domain-containing protein
MSNPRNRLTARLGFTLMEMVVTTAVIAVVLVTLGSAIVMTSRAMPLIRFAGRERSTTDARPRSTRCALNCGVRPASRK